MSRDDGKDRIFIRDVFLFLVLVFTGSVKRYNENKARSVFVFPLIPPLLVGVCIFLYGIGSNARKPAMSLTIV